MDSGKYRRYSCNGCGAEGLHGGSRGRTPSVCGPCSGRLNARAPGACSECGAEFRPRTDTQAQCSALCRAKARRAWTPAELTCAWCGKAFMQTNHAQAVCSARCKVHHWRSRNPEAVKRMNEVAAAKPRKPYKATPQTVCAVRFARCRSCDAWLDPRNRSAVLCASADCRRKDARMVRNEWAESQHRKAAPEIKCAGCGLRFCPMYGHSGATHCDPCARDALKVRRKAEKKLRDAVRRGSNGGKAVSPAAIFERDGWHCMLCRVETPASLRGSHQPTAPELDHIRPVSKGGAHTEDNLQLLCRACNSEKGDKYPYPYRGGNV